MAAMRRNFSGRFGCGCCAVLLLLLVVLCCCVRRSDAFRFGRRHESETEKARSVWNSWDFREPRTNSLNSAFPFNDGLLMMDAHGATPTSGRQKRYIGQFGDMIRLITGREPLLYNAYGNYCGLGGDSELKPVDDTDACCKRHDDCYGDAEAGECRNEWLQPKWIYYDWQAVELVPPAALLPFGADEDEPEDEKGNKNNDDDDAAAAVAAAPDHRVLNHDGPRDENATAAVTNDGGTAFQDAVEKFVSGDPSAQEDDGDKSRRKRQPFPKIQEEDEMDNKLWLPGPRIELKRIRRSSDGRQVIMCGLSNDDCRRAVCECDRIAAQCFAATDYDVKHKRSSILDLFVPQNRDPRFPNSVHARTAVEPSADPS